DIHVIWIFHSRLLKNNISNFLKKAHEIYFGRIYIYDNKNIYPVHLIPDGTWKNGMYGDYFKYYKKRKIHDIGDKITNFSLLKTKNNWDGNNYKIARFYDKQWWKNNG
ncbi:unnamed protein product, partial [marine sediment metagenome]